MNLGFNLMGDDESGGLGGQTVFDDAAQDSLTGSAGQDWFLLNKTPDGGGVQVVDLITDLAANETSSDIDFNLL